MKIVLILAGLGRLADERGDTPRNVREKTRSGIRRDAPQLLDVLTARGLVTLSLQTGSAEARGSCKGASICLRVKGGDQWLCVESRACTLHVCKDACGIFSKVACAS